MSTRFLIDFERVASEAVRWNVDAEFAQFLVRTMFEDFEARDRRNFGDAAEPMPAVPETTDPALAANLATAFHQMLKYPDEVFSITRPTETHLIPVRTITGIRVRVTTSGEDDASPRPA